MRENGCEGEREGEGDGKQMQIHLIVKVTQSWG